MTQQTRDKATAADRAARVHDIAVVGGGMVGATTALLLARLGLDVALVEAGDVPSLTSLPGPGSGEPFDLRVSAISPASRAILETVGAWQAIAEHRHCPFSGMRVWDRSNHAELTFDASSVGLPELGLIVENSLIQAALWSAADSLTTYLGRQVVAAQLTSTANELTLDEGPRIAARLVIAADGPESRLRAFAGIDCQRRAYGQRAVVAVIRSEAAHQSIARQVFLPDGPLAFLPLSDGRCSIVWSLPEAESQRLQKLDEATFCQELTAASDRCLGQILGSGQRAAFPLRMQHATHYIARRLVLVGDAAHVIHPLAGQGVNLGLLDAALLAETVGEAVARGRDVADPVALRRYARHRRADNDAMIAATDGLYRLFGQQYPRWRRLAGEGLRVVNGAEPVKRFFMRHAMGLGGELPTSLLTPTASTTRLP